jgi:hypothetical protein
MPEKEAIQEVLVPNLITDELVKPGKPQTFP